MDRGAEIGTIPEEAFSFDGYQVVRGEFFATHLNLLLLFVAANFM